MNLLIVLAAIGFIWWLWAAATRSQNRDLIQRVRDVAPKPDFVSGRCHVVDGDGIRVKGINIRFEGLDAPEHNQQAILWNGASIDHGAVVKSALIKKIGGKEVSVSISGSDKYGRRIGVVRCNGEDVNRWLVHQGHAIAIYGDRYKRDEASARRHRRGMWGYKMAYDPRAWRKGKKKRLWQAATRKSKE